MIALHSLSVSLGTRRVVDDVTASFPPGLTMLVGPNGAGKSSLIRAIAGLLPFTGTITLEGTALAAMAPAVRARVIGYLPQGHNAAWPIDARAIVALGRYPHGARDPARLAPADSAMVDEAMRLTGTDSFAGRPVTRLSGGEQARIALARLIATDAPVMLCDEPSASLDPRYQLEVMTLLKRFASEGRTVIMVSHDLAAAARFADSVVVLDKGRLAAAGPPADSLSDTVLASVFAVEALRRNENGEMLVLPWRAL